VAADNHGNLLTNQELHIFSEIDSCLGYHCGTKLQTGDDGSFKISGRISSMSEEDAANAQSLELSDFAQLLSLETTGKPRLHTTVLVPARRPKDQNTQIVTLSPGIVAEGKVVDGEGKPIANARVWIEESHIYTHESDSNTPTKTRHIAGSVVTISD